LWLQRQQHGEHFGHPLLAAWKLILPSELALRAGVKIPSVTPKIPHVILCKDYTVRPSCSGRIFNCDE
jgi:hypothetical protein